MYENPKYLLAGDSAVVIEFGQDISKETNDKVRTMSFCIEKSHIKGILEMIPTYRSLLVKYNPLIISLNELKNNFNYIYENLSKVQLPVPKIIEIPTCYGREYGEDIEFVASYNNITVDEVIKFHSSVDYYIYMLGFTPGFTYLGGLSKKLETPRLKEPRTKIPKGSTGIAGNQTGIYPMESPGGWQLIGRTPLKLYNPNRKPPIVLNPGDYLKFIPIDRKDFNEISNLISLNRYDITIREKR